MMLDSWNSRRRSGSTRKKEASENAMDTLKLNGEKEVIADIKCTLTFAFSNAGNTSQYSAPANAPTASPGAEKRKTTSNPLAMMKEHIRAASGHNNLASDTNKTNGTSMINAGNTCELQGKLMMTSYRLQFCCHPSMCTTEAETAAFRNILDRFHNLRSIQEYFTVPLGAISTIEKKNSDIKVSTKDHRKFHLSFAQNTVLFKVYELLIAYAFPQDISYMFAFSHRLPQELAADESKLSESNCIPFGTDWDIYKPELEWNREVLYLILFTFFQSSLISCFIQKILGNDKWRISDVNKGYSLIESYPQKLVVPSSIPDEVRQKWHLRLNISLLNTFFKLTGAL